MNNPITAELDGESRVMYALHEFRYKNDAVQIEADDVEIGNNNKVEIERVYKEV